MIDQEASARATQALEGDPQPPSFNSLADRSARDTFEIAPIGEYLRRQRQLRGVSIEELASLTRIPLRSLERLEGGEFDGETDGFVRGFVRTVATALGLDVDDAVARTLQEPPPGVWERHSSGRRLKQTLTLLVLAGGLVVAFLVLQAGWGLLAGASADDSDRAVVVWRDPVRALAEATGAEVDPAGEIDPVRGSRIVAPAPITRPAPVDAAAP